MKQVFSLPWANLLVAFTLCVLTPAAEERPNVVILLADDLGSKDLGCYGGPVKTPVLDGLAAKGVRFTDFHAGAAICSPSRATLLTGRQNLRTGIYGVLQDHMHNMHLLEREVTIAEVLQDAGYGTAHFGKWHIGMTSGKRVKPSPTEHGFDYWFGLSNGAQPNHRNPTNFMRNSERVGPMQGYSCQIVVSDAINWLETKADPDEPFFLNIWFNEPHAKLAAPDEIVSNYGDLKDEAAIYSATIDNSDRAIGRLVEKLKTMGELDNTIIVYSSDHGSYRADRNGGLNGNKGSGFQGGLRSPGIFFWPNGIRGDRTEDTPSGSVDLLPTICGLAGLDQPKGVHLDGTDLSPLLLEEGEFERTQPLFWLNPSSGHLATLREGRYTLMGYRDYQLPFDREKLKSVLRKQAELAGIDPTLPNLLQRVSNTTFTSPEYRRLAGERVRLQSFQEAWIPTIQTGGFSRFALYDLEADPQQKRDIAKQRPEVTERLKSKLLPLYKDVMADAPDWLPVEEAKKAPNPLAPLETRLRPLFESSCLDCHDADTKTPLNLEALGFDLADPKTRRTWEKVHHAIVSGSMPPSDKAPPDPSLLNPARNSLARHLLDASARQQAKQGRAPARRLTAREYEHAVQDILGVRTPLAELLPPESDAAPFDTMAAGQEMAPLHIRSFLTAADAALDEAIELGPRLGIRPTKIDYMNSPYINMWLDRELRRGGNTVLRTEDAFVTFDDRPHTTQSDKMGVHFKVPGLYRITTKAFAYQAKTPVTFCLYRCNEREGRRDLVATHELAPGRTERITWVLPFRPGDYFYIAPADHDWGPSRKMLFQVGARKYDGEGLGIRSLTIAGPLETQWPPARTRALLGKGVDFEVGPRGVRLRPSSAPRVHIAETVRRIGPRLFRRSLSEAEVESWVRLADPVLKEKRGLVEGLRSVLRGMLCAPDFLYLSSEPGPLPADALATRLSLLLWKTLPDEQLRQHARDGRLFEATTLRAETERLLADPRGRRFVEDFTDQWLRLDEIDATRPSAKLFPEYDDVLRQAMLEETRLFVADAFSNNRPLRVLIDSDHTFANRRLAQHYGIPDVNGLAFRRVRLPVGSPRGGLLTQASILKVTANGTNTSPVPRGNFVLSRLLGREMPPPPPEAGTVEPDTRGTTTIRETLAAHRDVAGCNRCHREIDPPGFAMEQFDPIGGFRTRYRSTGVGDRPGTRLFGRPVFEYKLGPPVDASGTTAAGQTFDGIREFKALLLREEDTIARHLTEQLIAYATGAEVQFADRAILDAILREAKPDGYRLGDLLHAIIQSPLFRNK